MSPDTCSIFEVMASLMELLFGTYDEHEARLSLATSGNGFFPIQREETRRRRIAQTSLASFHPPRNFEVWLAGQLDLLRNAKCRTFGCSDGHAEFPMLYMNPATCAVGVYN
jgi:hypothetical protein